ncbi:T9SS type B sorting domain-containing protein [Flavobacterium sp. LMO8]|uniref:gliding motility-associated C-terminal domain-containing protein n=1 Tax=Flavobacterium sp. LMO8 TaxID=2654244 RepID=UPI001290CE2E|nr:gliding motility-associated C-terminal domain-containing protein [Flavobacterium sp. LMO8]MQP24948.1 T9SS type B sorting domain-containing protein [Flavobacterium sp. LMO8]
MLKKLLCLIFLLGILLPTLTKGQDISLFTQVNGRYDFTFVGNTMNIAENNPTNFYVTNTSSSATLNLGPSDTIIRAYLYWAGSGDGDFEVDLNGTTITPDRTFSHSRFFNPNTFTYFSAFKDITTLVQTTGNGTYTLSNLDISPFQALHYSRKTNFAGWAILIVYENPSLTLNQLNIYDGLQGVPDALQINLTNLYVLNNSNAKAGFIAWEGDSQLATENFTVNGTAISNPFNPPNNVFNSTNSVTGSNQLYNMDLDIYEIDNYISIGDTSASIALTSFQDFIMINTVVTKLNSQLPDATIVLENPTSTCNSREVTLDFTVSNLNSTEVLEANTPITFYAGTEVIATTYTQNIIPIGGSENGNIILSIPSSVSLNFSLLAVVDDRGNGSGIVTELLENNNTFQIDIELTVSPTFNNLNPLTSCNLGLTRGIFDFSSYSELVKTNSSQIVSFHESYYDAVQNINPILNSFNYEALTTPKEIFVRIDNSCFSVTSFFLLTENCPPTVYNAVSPNGDGSNDAFFIDGLRDIFVNFEILIFNRWGKHLWTGNNNKPDWDGYVEEGVGSTLAPAGTYYYILYLNDPNYSEPLTGYLYINR